MINISSSTNKASVQTIIEHLNQCNNEFTPPLSETVKIDEYAKKIHQLANRIEIWKEKSLIGLIAIYDNQQTKSSFITNYSVLPPYIGQKISSQLMQNCLIFAESKGIQTIELEVNKLNQRAIKFYKKYGFSTARETIDSFFLMKEI